MADNFFGLTDTGRLRDNNEDAFIAQKLPGSSLIVACVIDGVGGYEGGEIAAQLAKDTILEKLKSRKQDLSGILKDALVAANEKIYHERLNNSERQSMACVLTLVLADVAKNEFHYAHIGDTRLYLMRDRSLVKVTRDHSFVGFLEDSKRLSEEEAMRHPKRNEINKALGFDPNMSMQADYMDIGHSAFLPGDLLLLCSDGLTDLVNSNVISRILTSDASLENRCKELINAANQAGGKDNITVVLVQNDKQPIQHKATKPMPIKKKEPVNQQQQTEERTNTVTAAAVKPKSNTLPLILLSLFCLVLLAGIIWLWNRQSKPTDSNIVVENTRNPDEQKLWQLLLSTPDTAAVLIDSSFTNPVTLTDTLTINKDSLYLKGNGFVIRADSSYKGPAFVVNPNCKYLLLEDITLSGFSTGIIAPAGALHLKNVRFENCTVPVMAALSFNNGPSVTGSLSDSIVFKRDTSKPVIK
jgi:serine/threonine protein phosphatase PrpC